jgi:hypothetical protein
MFGFRLRDGAIQMRTRRGSGSELTFDCNSGHWQAITSEDVHITCCVLRRHNREATNLNPDKTSTWMTLYEQTISAGRCEQSTCRLTGRLAADPDVRKTYDGEYLDSQ